MVKIKHLVKQKTQTAHFLIYLTDETERIVELTYQLYHTKKRKLPVQETSGRAWQGLNMAINQFNKPANREKPLPTKWITIKQGIDLWKTNY